MKDARLARIFKALSNEQRLKIFRKLCEWQQAKGRAQPADECCGVDRGFSRICCCVQVSPSTVSHHFKELQQAGLITVERTGQSFVCTVNPEAIDAVRDFLTIAPAK